MMRAEDCITQTLVVQQRGTGIKKNMASIFISDATEIQEVTRVRDKGIALILLIHFTLIGH